MAEGHVLTKALRSLHVSVIMGDPACVRPIWYEADSGPIEV